LQASFQYGAFEHTHTTVEQPFFRLSFGYVQCYSKTGCNGMDVCCEKKTLIG